MGDTSMIVVYISFILPLIYAQQVPTQLIFPLTSQSVNGSSAAGHCTAVTRPLDRYQCDDPTSSVVYDGHIPTLTGLDGNMWASQLLTINASSPLLVFDFTGTLNFQVRRVEMVVFNCPQWGISVRSVVLTDSALTQLGVANPNLSSCSSLVRVCIPNLNIGSSQTVLRLEFTTLELTDWIHIAEVGFYGNNGDCPPDIFIPEPTTATTSAVISTTPTDGSTGDGGGGGGGTTSATSTFLTSGMTDGTSGGGNTGAVVAGVVIALLFVAAIVVAVIVIIVIYLRRPQGKATFNTLRNSFRHTNTNTLEKTSTLDKTKDIEMNVKADQPPKKPARSAGKTQANSGVESSVKYVPTGGGGGPIYEDADKTANENQKRPRMGTGMSVGGYEDMDDIVEPAAVGGGTYDAVDHTPSRNGNVSIRKSQSPANQEEDTYNKLGGIGRRTTASKSPSRSEVDNSQETYSQLEKSGSVSKAANPMYSTVKTEEQPQIYAEVDKPKRRKPPPQPNQPPPEEYAVIDKLRSPEVPTKSDELLQELSQQEVENEVYSQPNFPSKSAISDTRLGENPLYNSTDIQFPPQDAVYAEPGPATVPLPNESGNIYEQIYEVKTLAPSAFMKETSPEEGHTESREGLYPCSSIYTVPEVNIEEKPLELSGQNIQFVRKLGSGNFGDVVLAKTVGLSCKDLKMSRSTDTNVQVLVAVKMLKQNANMMDRTLFDKEYKFMVRLNDPNVIRLLGVCKTSTPFIMMEYMENGDLNEYLKAFVSVIYSDSPEGNSRENKTITTTTLISLCTQIASAMKYLASKNFVHRDLATRNCLVGTNYQVKIADFGMSRNMYESHYYVIKGHAILPIRWMATECFYGQFSAKTDVWAFGVTMWEIFELARNEPYYEMEDKDLVKDAIKGENRSLLPCPKTCPEEVYRIMNLCWAHNSNDRETFENLHQALSSL